MSKVVYLMGAGASRGERKDSYILSGIPIVSEIYGEMARRADEIALYNWEPHATYKPTDRDRAFEVDLNKAQKELSADLKWLAGECANHATIDTFAKKLFLTKDRTNYKRLKRAFATFLLIEQITYKSDIRYDAFLANILNKSIEIPDDITIMTWNYDSQFEIALSGYDIRLTDMRYSPICLPVYNDENLKDRYKIFKINGSATFSDDRPFSSVCKATEQKISEENIRKEILWYYGNDKLYPDLSFAWDESDSSCFYKMLEQKIKDAITIVVIGYTFPYFNRETDRKILSMMGKLKRIIIQDPNAEAIVQSVEAALDDNHISNKVEIKTETHTNSFLIPREL